MQMWISIPSEQARGDSGKEGLSEMTQGRNLEEEADSKENPSDTK